MYVSFLASYFVELFSTFIIYGGKLDINSAILCFKGSSISLQWNLRVASGVGLVCFWKKAIFFLI
jgi:hypothetical protein